MLSNNFACRHNGPNAEETAKMLKNIGVSSMDELIEKTVPAAIRLKKPLNLPAGMNEYEYLNHLRSLGQKNKAFKTYIGQGYYNTITPAVIQRNILENPGWYTSYTPYQAEISQGRLEALMVFQTMIVDLTGMPLTNASLLDEATAAAEAMMMFYNARSREQQKADARTFFVSERLYPQTIDVIKTRAEWLGIKLVIGKEEELAFTPDVYGAIVQHIDRHGEARDYTDFIAKAHANNCLVAVASDLLALTLLKEPGVWGADCVLGSNQRFGLPMGFGGPSAGFFTCKDDFKRQIPGRIIGLTVDAQGNKAYRLALQTREQHIKRDKATSNICTAQALMATMTAMYAVWHGPCGLKAIAEDVHNLTASLAVGAAAFGYAQENKAYFDTLYLALPAGVAMEGVRKAALAAEINFHYADATHIGISLDETTSIADVEAILGVLATAAGKTYAAGSVKAEAAAQEAQRAIPASMQRQSAYLQHPVFHRYHSETDMMRYLKKLEVKDLSLNRAMIPLGSCTMKLNAAAEMMCLSMPEFAGLHPFVPADQAAGTLEMIHNLEKDLCEITGFARLSFQPNSGAAGEYAGLSVIRAYQKANGEGHRNICLIPASAHGTNPASAAMAGLKVVVVKSTVEGEIDVEDLKAKVAEHNQNVACLMVTYPSTHGVFEEAILDIIGIVHGCGAQVYMDGANMNAQVGLTSPGTMGADVCHLNLHKTFAMPHGGGGPGVGPIGVAKHLAPYLPSHTVVNVLDGQEAKRGAVAASPYGSAFILPITYGYVRMLGGEGLKSATEYAILNANYLKARLKDHYKIFYVGKQGMCAHEMILDCNAFSMSADVQVGDIAKRLMDYGFHAPTVAFPVHGTLMVEPTESEPLAELDRLVDAFVAIRQEIADIESGKADKANNLIKNAPHTMYVVAADTWERPYTRQAAAFPLPHEDKYWPTCGKVDDAFGDRNLRCTLENE